MRIVIKVGPSTLAHATGHLNIRRVEQLCVVMSDLKNAGYELSAVSASLVGCALGFWLFNQHPAKIFMGDTGSLFLGSLSASLAFGSKTPFAIVIIGCVYVMEGLSVILQVASYKLTKKRIFIMAPIHHHLEKSGYSENKICLTAVLVTLIGSAIALFLFRWTV